MWLTLPKDRLAGVVLLCFSLGVIWEDRVLPLGNFHTPGPGFLPLVLALILGGMGILVTLAGSASPPLGSLEWGEKWHALAILAGSVFSALALERLGYRLTVIILMGFILWVVERKQPHVVVAMAVGLSLGTFYLFAKLLKVPLPLGPGGF